MQTKNASIITIVRFDTIIVGSWVFSLVQDNDEIDTSTLRFLRLAKLLRLLRLVRSFQVFDVLHLLVGSIKCSLGVLLWSLVFLIAMMTMIALALNTLSEIHVADQNQPDRLQVFLYFGTFSRSMMSMWEVTLGNPAPIVWLLVNSVSEWYILFFLCYHAFVGFAIVNVVRGIFLHETFKVSETDAEVIIRENLSDLKHDF